MHAQTHNTHYICTHAHTHNTHYTRTHTRTYAHTHTHTQHTYSPHFPTLQLAATFLEAGISHVVCIAKVLSTPPPSG